MKKTKIAFVVSALLLLTVPAVFLVIYNQPGFAGEQIKTTDSYTLDIQRMNGADSHALNLTAGDVLQVEFETEKGSLHMEITAPDGTVIYAGNGKETSEFEINISETGAYTVTAEARHSKGSIHIQVREK